MPGRHHPPLAERKARREQEHIPVPGKCGRDFQLRAHLRASAAQILCRTASEKDFAEFTGISGSIQASEVPGLHHRASAQRDPGHPSDLDNEGIHRRPDPLGVRQRKTQKEQTSGQSSDYLDVILSDPSLPSVCKGNVVPAIDLVDDVYLRTLMDDEQILRRCR